MLVLGRKRGESLYIGNDICLSVEEIGASAVKLGIEAPKEVVILRSELKEKIASQNLKATQPADITALKSLSKQFGK